MKGLSKLYLILFVLLPGIGFAQNTTLSEKLKKHVEILASDSLEGRGLGTEGIEKARDYIISEFEKAGIEPLYEDYQQHFRFRTGNIWVPAVNITGIIKGADPVLKDEYIVLGAHYDHLGYTLSEDGKIIYNGADDNASGTASVIEVGKYLLENQDKLKRSVIIIAFDGEESGLNGAEFFVNNNTLGNENIKTMFSLDMVGMYDAYNGLDLKGIGSIKQGRQIAKEIADKMEITLKDVSGQLVPNTDTAPFGKAGIPAVHVFTGLKSPYHKPEDTYDLLDYEGMAKINLFLQQLVLQLSNNPVFEDEQNLSLNESTGVPLIMAGVKLETGNGFHRYDDEFYRADKVMNYSGGFFVQLPVGDLITIQQEALFDINGSHAESGIVRRYSATLPLNIQFGSPRSMTNNIARAFIFGGAYYRYKFADSYENDPENNPLEFSNEEWGYSAGFGMEVMRFHFSYTVRNGLTNVLNNIDNDVYDTNHMFSLGYRF
ncbi:MAG: M20/M25/M40 family metallo-hydrolase [Bacteroidota bacterium]